MLFTRSAVVLTILLASQFLTSCASPTDNRNSGTAPANTSNASNTAPKDNVDEFADFVRLPFSPDEVVWKEVAGKGLTAVIRFSPENATKMAAELTKAGPATTESLTVETWYPAELIAQSEMSGESMLKGQSYPADSFLNAPYTKGKFTRIENTDYFILQISS